MARLTASQVKYLTEPGRHRADPTLYLVVQPSGSKSWVQRLTIDGHRRDIGLGGYPMIGLVEARTRALENRHLVATGRDPVADQRRRDTPTFREAALADHEARRAKWRNRSHAAEWMRSLERYAFTALGPMPVHRIQQADVLRVLEPFWTKKPETARRVRQRIRAVLAWAQAHGYIDNNPAGSRIDPALPSMPKVKAHHRALHYRDVPAALATIDASGASAAAKLCLRFVVLTATRSGEARGARWSEIDDELRQCRIPAERTKTGPEHRVPLSEQAIVLLDKARALDDGSGAECRSAITTLRCGHFGPAQSHASNIVDSIVQTFATERPRALAVERARHDFDEVSFRQMAYYLTLRPLDRAFVEWWPNSADPLPDHFARHPTAHAVGHSGLFAPLNALVAVMLAVSLTVQFESDELSETTSSRSNRETTAC